MKLVSIYEGLAEANRLRMVHLLLAGPLGVKHLQELLGISQVRVSKHLSYLRERGLVEVDRRRNWMFYRLPAEPSAELRAHLACLAECAGGVPVLRADAESRRSMQERIEGDILNSGRAAAPREETVRPGPQPPTASADDEGAAAGGSGGVGLGSSGEEGYVD